HTLDELLQLRRGQRTRLVEDAHALAEHHEGGDGGDPERARELLLGFRVDLPEHDVVVLLGGLLVHGGEVAAGAAPVRPEVEDDDVVLPDGRLQIVRCDSGRTHASTLTDTTDHGVGTSFPAGHHRAASSSASASSQPTPPLASPTAVSPDAQPMRH